MNPEVVGFFHKPTFSVSYLAFDPASRRASADGGIKRNRLSENPV